MLNSVQRECILCEASLNSKLILSPVMANDFDGQFDYLEQFGSSNVSIFIVYVQLNSVIVDA